MPKTPIEVLSDLITALEQSDLETVTRKEMYNALIEDGASSGYAGNAVTPSTPGGAVRRLLDCGRLEHEGPGLYRIGTGELAPRRSAAPRAAKVPCKRPGSHLRKFTGHAAPEGWELLTTFTFGDCNWKVEMSPNEGPNGARDIKVWAEGEAVAKANFWLQMDDEGDIRGRDMEKMREHRPGMEDALFAALEASTLPPAVETATRADEAPGKVYSDEEYAARTRGIAEGVAADLGAGSVPASEFISLLEAAGMPGAKRWLGINHTGTAYRLEGEIVKISSQVLDDLNDLV